MMSFEPLFMLSAVPGDVASAVGSVGIAAVLGLWRRLAVVTDRGHNDKTESLLAMQDLGLAIHTEGIANRAEMAALRKVVEDAVQHAS